MFDNIKFHKKKRRKLKRITNRHENLTKFVFR